MYEWVSDYCAAMPGAVREWKAEWGVWRFLVGGKMFLMDGEDKGGRRILTLRLEPLRGDDARRRWPNDVAPGYYMNKLHWNSIARDGTVPDDELKRMLDESYRLIFASLTKKAQAAALEQKA